MGVVLAISSGFVYSIYLVYLENSSIKLLHPMQMAFLSNLTFGVLTFIYSNVIHTFNMSQYTPSTVLFCLIAILMISIGGNSLFQYGVRYTDATTTSLLSTTEPITAVIMGILFMHEQLTVSKLMGCACILFGVILVILGEHYAVHEA